MTSTTNARPDSSTPPHHVVVTYDLAVDVLDLVTQPRLDGEPNGRHRPRGVFLRGGNTMFPTWIAPGEVYSLRYNDALDWWMVGCETWCATYGLWVAGTGCAAVTLLGADDQKVLLDHYHDVRYELGLRGMALVMTATARSE
jgi:hypothetical protein